MKKLFHKGVKFWETEASLRIFFILMLIMNFVLTPLTSERESGSFIARTFYLFLIITGSYALVKNRAVTYSIILFSVIASLVLLLNNGNNMMWLHIFDGILQVMFYMIFLTLILMKVFKGGVYSRERLEGAMTGYLLIGNLFATLYYTFNMIFGPETFHFPGEEHLNNFIYFSFTTLTTLGYGDIVPIHPSVRSLSNLEAVIGQLYPAVLIARLLSLENLHSIAGGKSKKHKGEEE